MGMTNWARSTVSHEMQLGHAVRFIGKLQREVARERLPSHHASHDSLFQRSVTNQPTNQLHEAQAFLRR